MDFAGTLLFTALDWLIYRYYRDPDGVRNPSPNKAGTNSSIYNEEDKAFYDAIVKELFESYKSMHQDAPKFHAISFWKMKTIRVQQTALNCVGQIRQILRGSEEDLQLKPENLNDDCYTIIGFIKDNWRTLDILTYTADPVKWKEKWQKVNELIEKVPTDYPRPSSIPLEAWKDLWLKRIRGLFYWQQQKTEVNEKGKKMDVHVKPLKTCIEN